MKHNYIISVLLLILFFLNESKASNDIPFQMVNGLMIVDAEVNGLKGSFIFDTGASDLLVDKTFDLESKKSVEFSSTNGTLSANQVNIKKFRIGSSIEFNNHEAYIMDLQSLKDYTSIDISGILGGQILSGILKVDFKHQVISVLSPFGMDFSVYQHKTIAVNQGVPLIELTLDGEVYNFILDSGASAHILDKNTAQKVKNIELVNVSTNVVTAGGDSKNIMAAYVDMNFVGKVSNSRFLLQDLKHLSLDLETQIDGLLSISSLSLNVLYIDFANNAIHYQ